MVDWNHIESIFLDLDGTLLDLRFDNYFWVEFIPEHYAQHNQLVPEKARAEILARMRALRGTLDWYCTDF
ncbi:MAG TPA: haloacid dehalogenase, partial [Gammaproteobacteria bacterium]|nr:haloacid dehalogenase [Gammaproteobacteria bacterium]